MRILFIAPLSTEAATVRYRCSHLAEALRQAGHEADVVSADSPGVTISHDVVVLHRLFWNGAGRRFHTAARAVGAVVVYSVDDLIFDLEFALHIGMLHPGDPARFRYHRNEVEENRAMLAHADFVIVSTEFLAGRARAAVATDTPIRVVRNFPGEAIRLASAAASRDASELRALREDDRITLGYLSGSPTHDGDLADIAAPLASVLRKHPNVRLLAVGAVGLPEALEPFAAEGRIRRHPAVPWRDLPALLAGIDINLAPLDPTRAFGHAKSEVKFLEAAIVGVPTVAGWAAGFAEGVGEGENCLLAKTADDWESMLTRLITDRAAWQRIARHSATLVSEMTAERRLSVVTVFEEAYALRLGDGDASTCPSITVRRPLRERAFELLKVREAAIFRIALRLARHWTILRDEVRH